VCSVRSRLIIISNSSRCKDVHKWHRKAAQPSAVGPLKHAVPLFLVVHVRTPVAPAVAPTVKAEPVN